jgi:hypothetical protein
MGKYKTPFLSLLLTITASRLFTFARLPAGAEALPASAGSNPRGAYASSIVSLESVPTSEHDAAELSLNGFWELGVDRRYDLKVRVPGLATDPTQVNKATLWYKREVGLPQGNWTHATLVLNGARFCPAVYVNGQKTSEAPGGMTVTTHLLKSEHVAPGRSIVLEVALKSLKDVDPRDASRIPKADRWRSNLSSCL